MTSWWRGNNVYFDSTCECTNTFVSAKALLDHCYSCIRDTTVSVEGDYWKNYIDTFLMMLCGGIPWQPYYQRALAVKTTKNAQILSVIATLGCFLFISFNFSRYFPHFSIMMHKISEFSYG